MHTFAFASRRAWPRLTPLWALALAATLGACSGKPTCNPDTMDCPDDGGGGLPPDICNTQQEAESDSRCQLTPCADAGAGIGCDYCYISFSGDQDFWLAPLPSAPTASTLLHIYGGYGAPATAVNFAVTVLKEDGTTAVTRKVDHHGQAMPGPVDIILPFNDPKLADLQGVAGAKVLLLVGDEASTPIPNFDVRSPYSIGFCMEQNPDTHEPNDTPATATPVPLAAGANGPQGQVQGYLATENDVDYYSFDASAAAGKIIYLHVTGPVVPPFPNYRLEYTLFDPNGVPIANDVMANQLLQIDLATARKVVTPGTWQLKLDGYQSPNGMMTPVPGDLNVQYTVDLEILDELDTNDTPANDTSATAKVITMGLNSSNGLQGRLSYVPDPDWFRLDLQPTSSAGVIHYKLTVDPGPGRFAPLTRQGHVEDRQVRLVAAVPGVDYATQVMACTNDNGVCPKGYDGAINTNQAIQLVSSICKGITDADGGLLVPPMCLWAERDQDPGFSNYRNMEGEIPVDPHPGAVASYFIVAQDDENDFADDRVYTLQVSYEDDPDETMRDGLPYRTTTSTLASGGSVSNPPAAGQLSGELSFGYGRIVTNDPGNPDAISNYINSGMGVRGFQDYDAVPNDYDRFEIDFPGGLTGDQTWELQWDVDDLDGGGPPGDLALEVSFCNSATLADGGCNGPTPVLVYSGDRIQPWYGQSLTDRQVLYSQADNGAATTTTAEAIGCFCYESQYVAQGKYFVNVAAANRTNNNRIRYRVRQGYSAYPASYSLDGGTVACPAGQVDGGPAGCGFTSGGP